MPKQEESKKDRDTSGETTEVSRDTTKNPPKKTGGKRTQAARQEAEEMVEGAMYAGSETGSDLGSVAKGAVIDAMQGVEGTNGATRRTLGGIAQSAIKGTIDVGGDVVRVAVKVVEGAMEVSDKTGLKAEEAALAAATGAINATEEISGTLATAVTKALSAAFSGIRLAFGVPLKKPTILVVDSNRSNAELMVQHIVQEGYQINTATSLEELDKTIAEKGKAALSLIDLSGFDEHIWERCDQLRQSKIPFILISPQRSPAIQRDSMKHGASGLLVKPLGIKELMEYIHTLLGD